MKAQENSKLVFSAVKKNGWILPKKDKYTMRDVNALMAESLFSGGGTLTEQQAGFICKCSAVLHDTDYSKAIADINNKLPIGKL